MLEEDPTDLVVHIRRAEALRQVGLYDQAKSDLRYVLRHASGEVPP